MSTYPATTYADGVELTITSGNQLHEIINGTATEEITTESGMVPSVRKAIADSMLFKQAIDWAQGSVETDPLQTRNFNGTLFWAPAATTANPIAMGASPVSDSNWSLAPVGRDTVAMNANLISNSHFEFAGTVTNPPDAVARNYDDGDEIFSGIYAKGAITNVTFVDGVLNGFGELYVDVVKNTKMKEATSGVISSIAGTNGEPYITGSSVADAGDYYRVTFSMNNTFSVKLEQGSVSTGHEFGVNGGETIALDGGNVLKPTSKWLSESVRDTGFSSLQTAIDYAISNSLTLELRGGVYLDTPRLTVSGDLNIFVINPTTIKFDSSIDATDLGLLESRTGTLRILGAELTLDANNNTTNGAVISSLTNFIEAENKINIINLPNGSAYWAATTVNQDFVEIHGNGYFENIHTDNIKNGVVAIGTAEWWNEDSNFDCSFRIGSKSNIKCTEFAYRLNKLFKAECEAFQVSDSSGYYKDYRERFDKDSWVANPGADIFENTFTSSGSAGVYIEDQGITIGEDYFVVFGGGTNASGIQIRNGTSGTSPLIGTVINKVYKFTAQSKFIYIRNIGSGTTQMTNFCVYKESLTTNNIFQCSDVIVNGTSYRGTKNGPVIGIDSKNFRVSGTSSNGITRFGLQIDIESVDSEPQQYPDAYGMVNNNVVKYAGLRGGYVTARRADILDNSFYFATDNTANQRNTIQVNTRNEVTPTSQVYIAGNKSIGCNDADFLSVSKGTVVVGPGNLHDSSSVYPYRAIESLNAVIRFKLSGNTTIPRLSTSDTVTVGESLCIADESTTSLKLPPNTQSRCSGWQCSVVRDSSNSKVISVTTLGGSINGAGVFNWQPEDKILSVFCVSDNNDYVVSSS